MISLCLYWQYHTYLIANLRDSLASALPILMATPRVLGARLNKQTVSQRRKWKKDENHRHDRNWCDVDYLRPRVRSPGVQVPGWFGAVLQSIHTQDSWCIEKRIRFIYKFCVLFPFQWILLVDVNARRSFECPKTNWEYVLPPDWNRWELGNYFRSVGTREFTNDLTRSPRVGNEISTCTPAAVLYQSNVNFQPTPMYRSGGTVSVVLPW